MNEPFASRADIRIHQAAFRDGSPQQIARDITGLNDQAAADKLMYEFFNGFKQNSTIIMVGSGGNSFTKFLEQKYARLNFIALDVRYQERFRKQFEVVVTKRMLANDWTNIDLPNATVDGIFCSNSFPFYFGDKEEIVQTVGELTRISRSKARMLFNGRFESGGLNSDYWFIKSMTDNGWQVKINQRSDISGTYFYYGSAQKK